MQFILTSNTLENPAFSDFIRAATARYPKAAFIICGDLLNIFPEPGEDLCGSIFYEIYGDIVVDELDKLARNHFTTAKASPLVQPLRELFVPGGRTYLRGLAIAEKRYTQFLRSLETALGHNHLYFVPGNMDYPQLAFRFAQSSRNIHFLDGDTLTTADVSLAGLGGIPNTAHPFRGVVEISPYEMDEAEFERRLNSLWGVSILITHLSPKESPILEKFFHESPLKLLICRAPFDFTRPHNFRGDTSSQRNGDKVLLTVSPFAYPYNEAFVLDIPQGNIDQMRLEVFCWDAEETSDLVDHDSPHALLGSPFDQQASHGKYNVIYDLQP